MATPEVDAVVAGAGIAGLAAALDLQAAGLEVFVVDPSDRPGGVLRTEHASGYVVERGPNTFQAKAPLVSFLERQRLADLLVRASPASRLRRIYRDGALRDVPMSPVAMARTSLLSTRGKLRALAEPFIRRGSGATESVADFVARRFGDEAVEALVGPFLTGIYAGDERQLGAHAVFGSLVEHERRRGSVMLGALGSALSRRGPRGLPGTYSTGQGLGPFARRIADHLVEPPALGSRVTRVSRDGDRWRVDVSSASGESTVTAGRVVVAVPALEAAELLRGLDSELARVLEEIRYAPIVSLSVGVSRGDVNDGVEGFGFLVPREEDLGLLGCLYMSQLFSGRAPEGMELLQCLIGGVRWPEAVHQPDDALYKRLAEDLERTIGLRGEFDPLALTRWPRAVPQPGPDHVARLRWVHERLSETPGIAVAGSWVAGVGVADTLASGVAAAAVLTGAD